MYVVKAMRFFVLLLVFTAAPVQAYNWAADAYTSFVARISKSITLPHKDMEGNEFETHRVIYNHQPVTFQYQFWRIRKHSVCAQLKGSLLGYSQCTQAAKRLFSQTCHFLRKNPRDHWKYYKLKNLYCNAAVEFEAVIGGVPKSGVFNRKVLKRRQLCAVLRVRAMTLRDVKTVELRDAVCDGGEIDFSDFSISDFLGGGQDMSVTW
ncbi:MAG: hypothetical protein ACPGF7_11855 [Pontibacterium sp.]